jgi:hypothetical protein
MFGIDAILGVGLKLVDKFFPDATQAEQAKLKLFNQAIAHFTRTPKLQSYAN